MPQVRLLFYALFLIVMIPSCADESLFDKSLKNPATHMPGRTLSCKILKVVSQHPYSELPVKGAVVKLYLKNPEVKQANNPALAKAITDTSGMAVFHSIYKERYYVQVSHNSLANIQRLVKTPAQAIVNFEVFIYP